MIAQVLHPALHDLGGFQVRRVLPSPHRTMVGPFIFVDEFGPAIIPAGQTTAIRPHPHIGLSTVSWLFEGAIDHRDSLGNFATVRPGEIALMTAGKGIVHSERGLPAQLDIDKPVFGMQTWLALPDGLEDMDPAFEVHTDLPLVEDQCASARVVIGTLWGKTAPTNQHAPAIYADIVLAPGGSIPIDAEAEERAVMLVAGEAEVDGVPLPPYALAVLAPGVTMKLQSAQGGRVMLLGGQSFATPRHIWWNFVHSRRDVMQQAARDWQEGRFPPVPGDPDEYIPLP